MLSYVECHENVQQQTDKIIKKQTERRRFVFGCRCQGICLVTQRHLYRVHHLGFPIDLRIVPEDKTEGESEVI